jgi:hypothetical protein
MHQGLAEVLAACFNGPFPEAHLVGDQDLHRPVLVSGRRG